MDLRSLSVEQLVYFYSSALDELLCRKVIRSAKKPINEYAQWCVATLLGLKCDSENGNFGVDADGHHYFIQGIYLGKGAKENGYVCYLKNLRKRKFDFLATVIFDEQFGVKDAWLIPYELVLRYASFNTKSRSYTLVLKGPLLKHPQVVSIKAKF